MGIVKDKIAIGIYLNSDLKGKLKAMARKEHRSLSGQIAWILEQSVK